MAHVLVVDDDDDIRELVAMRVRRAGHETTCHGDPRAAVAEAATRSYDLALLDWSMPFLNGGELCARLRELPHLAGIPIVIVTAFTDDNTRAHGLLAGASGFLYKPFILTDLDAHIEQLAAASCAASRPRAGASS